ncbi:hypothetical protein PTKIN_Ptkin14bG0208400 [Pterospermum kingtungense]
MAILNRLPTMDRLKKWGIAVDDVCCLCKEYVESRNHVFFECHFSKNIWFLILRLCGIQREVGSWDDELRWAVSKFKGKTLISVVLKCAWCAFINSIWRERNNRLHRKEALSANHILEHIKWCVRVKIANLNRVTRDVVNPSLYDSWGLGANIFCTKI